MAETTRTDTTTIEDNSSGDVLRKIVAAIVGIIIIILLVLFAKWVGDRIRERFVTQRPAGTPRVVAPSDESTESGFLNVTPTPSVTWYYTYDRSGRRIATYSSIPATGTGEANYLLIGFFVLAGTSSLVLARRIAQ